MKTLNIGHNYHVIGGSDKVLLETVGLMNNNGHIAIPFCSKNSNNEHSEYDSYFPEGFSKEKSGILNFISFYYNFDSRRKLISLLKDNPDIVVAHLHIYYGRITTSILRVLKDNNIKIIQSLHEYKIACPVYTLENNGDVCNRCIKGNYFHCVVNRCKDGSLLHSTIMATESYFSRLLGDVRLVDKFISVSNFHRNIMIEAGVPPQKISTIYNFVNVSDKKYECKHDDYFLYFGRIEKLKGIDTLIKAFNGMAEKLIIVGDGGYKNSMLDLVRDSKNIQYLGFKNGQELETLISRSTGVIVPSEWYENCPMNILEAKAYGRPVIGSRIGGIPELINDGIDGYLFECKDYLKLRALILNVKQKFSDLSINSRYDAQARFSQEIHYELLMKEYNY